MIALLTSRLIVSPILTSLRNRVLIPQIALDELPVVPAPVTVGDTVISKVSPMTLEI